MSDSTAIRQQQRVSAAQAGLRLGERMRQLRVAASMTQTDLAGDRFSKEYMSQIERGKTRPTRETIDWLAQRLGVDAGFLANGVSADERGRVDAALARAEALLEARRNDEALEEFEGIRAAVLATGMQELESRALSGEATARMRLGVARYKLNSIQTAIGLFDEALKLAERSEIPSDQLRSNVLAWRSRCYRRRRDLEAAREDVERALELAEGLNDKRTAADVYFQASIIADREGHWVLARSYAERAKAAYEELSDRGNLGRLLNNLGGINFLLGHPEEAVDFLKDAVRIALEVGNDAEAAHAVNGIAQVHLRTGEIKRAEEQARYALELLGDRVDEMSEIGNAQLVLGRALLEQDRLDEADEAFQAGERAYDQLSSGSHRASAWVAQGDLAARRGDDRAAARLYRQAADALQDVRF
jgi:tetratricopeptide (TPR) repeat protein